MAFSAFGDEIPDDPTPPSPVARQPQTAPAQVSAFGDPLSAFGDAFDDAPAQPVQSPGVMDRVESAIDNSVVGDFGRSVARGGVGVGDAVMGMAGMLSGGRIPQALGYNTSGVRQHMDQADTPERQASRQALEKAQGFGGTLQALADNPGNIPHLIAESVPSMVGGGMAGRGIALGARALGIAPAAAGVVGAGAGEGLVAAGQQAEQTRQTTGTLTPGQSGLALASGALTGLLGAAGARIGRRHGVADIDMQLAGQNGVDVAKGFVNRALTGTGIESLEELTQSGQQQVLTNLANDRPAMEGVTKQMTLGGVVGGAMGGAAGLRRPSMDTVIQQPAEQAPAAPVAAPQPEAMATPEPTPQTSPAVPKTPFAGSSNVRPLFQSMGMDQQQMDNSLALLADDEPDIEAARRGTISWEETGRLAALTGTTVAKLRKHRLGVAFNAEEQVAATRLLKDQTVKTLDLSAKISSGNATEIEQANFLQSLNDLRTTQKAVMASRAEIGRAMSAMRADLTTMKQAGHMLDSVGGAQGAKAIADALTNAARIGGVEAANKLARQAGSDGFWTFYKSMLLSSPDTHVVNMVSNLATSLMQVPTRALAGGIGAAKRAVGLNGETRIGESAYQLGGMLEGAINGARGAVSSWRTGEDAFGNENKAEVYRNDYPGQQVWGVPLRLLQSEDQFFKYLNDGMARYAGAYRMAANELKGQGPAAVHKRVQEIIANPPAELVEAGEDAALFHTFNNRAGEITQAVNRLRHAMPYGTGNAFIPFLKTPMNLVTYSVKHSPAAPIFKQVRQDLKAGGHVQEEALARMGIGSLLMSLGVLGALNGNVSGGGPEDPEERRAWLAAGNQPYSLKINGEWQQYSRIEPMATLVGIAADVAHGWETQELGMASMMKAMGRNFMSKTWLQGLSGVMQAMTDPDRYGGSWVNRTAATLVQPATLLSHVGRYMDPYQRETDRDSFTDQLKFRLPGLRESLPIKRDQFGAALLEPQRQIGRAGPILSAVPSDDPVRLEAGRLGWAPLGMRGTFTLKSTTPGQRSEKVELTTEQLNELNELAGSRMHADATVLMRSKAWQAMDDDERTAALDKIMSAARRSAKQAFTPYLRNGSRGLINLHRQQTAAMARSKK
ncbi:hypothetical protein PAGU2196_23230 [Pseudomonas sp. PAGU 2196]|uniref:hypothetical protein n=1 Tax=Pseudomonas sp. PAGU 2196 TaxID=2793997 RepID=UPI001EDEEB32|nr:hypothetical protein [Pseudomonas sp. PAGU 2196]GHS81489.1 hypothetical protein PAGU2196_23230 [Pseudomonas sp. PAGU 2196]